MIQESLETLIDEETTKIINKKIQTLFPFYWTHKWELVEENEGVYTFETERDNTRYTSYPEGRK